MKNFRHILILFALFIFTAVANAQNGEFINHKVTQGQTLFSISKMYDTTVEVIVRHNPGSAKKLSIGQTLRIPKQKASAKSSSDEDVVRNGKLYHTIRSKETLFSLGKRYGVTPDEISIIFHNAFWQMNIDFEVVVIIKSFFLLTIFYVFNQCTFAYIIPT